MTDLGCIVLTAANDHETRFAHHGCSRADRCIDLNDQRRARRAADQQAAAYWASREQTLQEILHRANRAALEYLQA
jgi:hypothetical protein